MTRLLVIPGLCLGALATAPAWADVKLTNKDSRAHDIIVKCGSTVQRSIQAGTTTSLGKGPCTVTVKTTGASLSGSGNDTLVIRRR
jgi:hypothetical protein